MLIGEYGHNIDAKGRLIFPAKFCEDLGDTMMVTRGLVGCLCVYTMEQWKLLYEKLMLLPTTKKEARMYVRMVTSKAAQCELDAQGRILIPASLIQIAHLEKECIITGTGNRVEIWAKNVWEQLNADNADNFEEMAESLTEFL